MSATTDINSLALQASELTGLPTDFVKALVIEEGTLSNTNNPFDITNYWASVTGFGNYVTGLWNILGSIPGFGPSGVAIFNDARQAVLAWAAGILQFSAYSQFRADMAKPNVTARQLAQDLQNAGYAGNDSTYANKIATLYQQVSGKSADAPLTNVSAPPTQVTPPITTNPNPLAAPNPSSNSNITLSFGQGILHVLIAFVLVIIAAMSIYLGFTILLHSFTEKTFSLLKGINE